jgi:hypothetical protein
MPWPKAIGSGLFVEDVGHEVTGVCLLPAEHGRSQPTPQTVRAYEEGQPFGAVPASPLAPA